MCVDKAIRLKSTIYAQLLLDKITRIVWIYSKRKFVHILLLFFS